MGLSPILVFVHVIGAIALSAGTFISLLGMVALRRAQRVDEARSILRLLALSEPISGIALVVTPVAGLLMTLNTWGWQHAWINVALVSMVLLLLPVGAITGIRRNKIFQLVKQMPDETLPPSVKHHIHDPLLGTTANMMVSLIVGIEFLMTTKPVLDGSLIAIGLSVLLGVAFSLPLWQRKIDKH
jgi:uncharacterized membrane protein